MPENMGICAIVASSKEDAGARIYGMGILIADSEVITCAHVIDLALELGGVDPDEDNTVWVSFPYAEGKTVQGRVDTSRWYSAKLKGPLTDIAIIQLSTTAPASVARARLKNHRNTKNGEDAPTVFGYRSKQVEANSWISHPYGEHVAGRVMGSLPNGLGQFESSNVIGAAVKKGFSGAGIYDPNQDAVIGMVVSVDKDETKKIVQFIDVPSLKESAKTVSEILWNAASRVHRALAEPSTSVKPVLKHGASDLHIAIRSRIDSSNPRLMEFTLLCLYRDDLLKVFDRVMRLISHKDARGIELFFRDEYKRTDTPSEAQSHNLAELGTPGASPIRNAVPASYGTITLEAPLKTSEFPTSGRLHARFHIRTLFGDASVNMNNEIRSAAASGVKQLESHLLPIDLLLSGCASYADAIRQGIHESAGNAGRPSPSMVSPEMTRASLDQVKVPKRLVTELVDILKERERIERDVVQEKMRDRALLEIAAKLRDIDDRESSGSSGYLTKADPSPGPSRYLYVLRMEEALVRMRTGMKDEQSRAASMYEQLAIRFERCAAVRYRLAWVLGRQGDFQGALEKYAEADLLLQEALKQSPLERARTMNLEEVDKMSVRLPRLVGFQYWQIAKDYDRKRNAAKYLEYVVTAYQRTEPAMSFEDEDELMRVHNNLLFFAVEYLSAAKMRGEAGGEVGADNLSRHLDYLEGRVDLSAHDDVNQVDTMCFAYEYLGAREKAVVAAKRVQELLIGPDATGEALDETHTEYLRRAHRVLEK